MQTILNNMSEIRIVTLACCKKFCHEICLLLICYYLRYAFLNKNSFVCMEQSVLYGIEPALIFTTDYF